MEQYPKISIVTPSFNDVEYLETTILSVINQQYPNLEYIIIDGGSTDGSIEIIKKYESKLTFWISEKDSGMYSAIHKGFEKSSGEIMGWINSDDILHPYSLFSLGQIFGDFENVHWIQGFPNTVDERGRIVHLSSSKEVDKFFFYSKKHRSLNKFIQQESTFWRRDLWDRAGGYISTSYKYAGDFDLWIRFFQYEKLYNINALLGAFRLSVSGQASQDNYQGYLTETFHILQKYPLSSMEQRRLSLALFFEFFEKKFSLLYSKFKVRLKQKTIVNQQINFDFRAQKFRMK